MRINIVTIFPEFFEAPLSLSIPGRARRGAGGVPCGRPAGLHARPAPHGRRLPFGGGAGMVMKPEPFFEAVDVARRPQGPVVLMSARGRRFRHADAVRLALEPD
jgi:tRNA (guanine37-N1)-methyltransferase